MVDKKKILVDFTIHAVMEVPCDWDEELINFHFNESSWCVSSLLDTLKKREEDTLRCLCGITDVEFVREATEDDIDDWGYDIK